MYKKTIFAAFLLVMNLPIEAKQKLTETEFITETLTFNSNSSDKLLRVFNVYGSIDVEGYDGDEVRVEAINKVSANSAQLIDEGLAEIGLNFVQQGDELLVYLDSPFTYIDDETGKIWHSDTCWKHDDCSRKHKRKAYRYHMNIKVKVPKNTNLDISTINNGDITITDIDAKKLSVNNINGAIDMVDVAGKTYVNAINKDINIYYSKNPNEDSVYESINGDINISFAGEPDAEVVYQTMHGDMYTAFDVAMMAPLVQQSSKQKEHGIQYKLDANSRLKIGDGGPEYRFETLNGDIKLQGQ